MNTFTIWPTVGNVYRISGYLFTLHYMWRGSEGSSIAIPMLAAVIAPAHMRMFSSDKSVIKLGPSSCFLKTNKRYFALCSILWLLQLTYAPLVWVSSFAWPHLKVKEMPILGMGQSCPKIERGKPQMVDQWGLPVPDPQGPHPLHCPSHGHLCMCLPTFPCLQKLHNQNYFTTPFCILNSSHMISRWFLYLIFRMCSQM